MGVIARSVSKTVIANDEGYNQIQRRFPSILAEDPPTLHYCLRMEGNRRLTTYLDEMSSFITVLEMLTLSPMKLQNYIRDI